MRVRHNPEALTNLRAMPFYAEEQFIERAYRDRDIYTDMALEVGVGKGDYLLAMAEKYPHIYFLGVEFNPSVLYVAAKKLAAANVTNVLLTSADALLVLPQMKENSVNYLILNHSDPWPKKRHEKRRLTHPRFLELYYRVINHGGKLIFKTDNDLFAEYTLEKLLDTPFIVKDINKDYTTDTDFDARTEYEGKFLAKGVKIKRIIAVK